MKKKRFLNTAIRPRISACFAVLLTAAIFTLAGCGDTGSDADLSGSVTIIPNAGVITNTPLTAYYYGGAENITNYRWKRGNTNVGTNSNTYTPDQAGIYTVTVSASGYKDKTSAGIEVTSPIGGGPDLSGNVTISPTIDVRINTTLGAAYIGPEAITSYQWKRDSVNVGTNSNTYTPDQAGLYTVTAGAAGYKSKTSAAVLVTSAGGNIAPKTLQIIGITENYITQASEKGIAAVFPAGTALENAKADLEALYLESGAPRYAAAGVDFQSPIKVGNTYTTAGPLYTANETPWTSSGTVDMFAFVSDGTKGYLYKVPNLLIQSAVTTVSLFDLDVVFLGEIAIPQESGISGVITLADMPANPAPGRIWINVGGSKAGVRWYNDSHGGNSVDFSRGYANLPWKIKISDFVWNNSADAGRTDFFPADLSFSLWVTFEGDYDSRNYIVSVPAPKHINSAAGAVNINLGVVSLVKPEN